MKYSYDELKHIYKTIRILAGGLTALQIIIGIIAAIKKQEGGHET